MNSTYYSNGTYAYKVTPSRLAAAIELALLREEAQRRIAEQDARPLNAAHQTELPPVEIELAKDTTP